MNTQVHMVMGTEEAKVINVALGMFLKVIDSEIKNWQDTNTETQDELMSMLSVKFSAEQIHDSIAELLSEVEEIE
jgi:hypothetical protein